MPSKFEKKAKIELENDGWKVDTKWGMNRFARDVDYFHLFDILAHQPGIVRWIAIKGQGGVPSELRKRIEEIDMGSNNVKEIWTYSRKVKKGIKARKFTIRKEIL